MFWKKRTYLDYAAGLSGNASSPHEEGRRAKAVLEAARERIAQFIEVKADDVVFTSGATEANALAILGHVRAVRKSRRNNAHVLYLPSAHASIVENMKLLAAEGVVVERLPIKDSRVDIEMLAKILTPNTVLVSMDAVCGETGVIWNTREVAQVLKGKNIVLHVDASQAPLTQKVTRAHFNADMLTFDISKISPLRGLGVLVAHRTIPLEPLYRGGGQERGLRAGSELPELAQSFAEALALAVENREVFCTQAGKQRAMLVEQVMVLVPEVLINEAKHQVPNILNISLVGRDTDYLVALLDEMGFAVSTKSACETDSEEGSRAVLALTGDIERAKSTLRISWGPETSTRDLDQFALALAKSLKV
jgi:cysteine desulfurase